MFKKKTFKEKTVKWILDFLTEMESLIRDGQTVRVHKAIEDVERSLIKMKEIIDIYSVLNSKKEFKMIITPLDMLFFKNLLFSQKTVELLEKAAIRKSPLNDEIKKLFSHIRSEMEDLEESFYLYRDRNETQEIKKIIKSGLRIDLKEE